MSGFSKGIIATLLTFVVLVSAARFYQLENESKCNDLNYTVWAFERCMADNQSRCFITPEHVQRYDRALTEMRGRCDKWKTEEF